MVIKLIRAKDLSKSRFGKITVEEPIRRDKKNIFWRCRCDCGREIEVSSSNIKRMKYCNVCAPLKLGKNSCKWKGFGELSGAVVSRIYQQARRRRHEFSVDAEYLWKLFLSQDGKCAISNIVISLPKTRKDIDLGNKTASLDRIDSGLGYVADNIQWVHKDINLMKQQFSMTQFVKYCHIISLHQGKQNV